MLYNSIKFTLNQPERNSDSIYLVKPQDGKVYE